MRIENKDLSVGCKTSIANDFQDAVSLNITVGYVSDKFVDGALRTRFVYEGNNIDVLFSDTTLTIVLGAGINLPEFTIDKQFFSKHYSGIFKLTVICRSEEIPEYYDGILKNPTHMDIYTPNITKMDTLYKVSAVNKR